MNSELVLPSAVLVHAVNFVMMTHLIVTCLSKIELVIASPNGVAHSNCMKILKPGMDSVDSAIGEV